MNQNAVIAGTFADLRSVKSRSVVVLHIEVPIERAADVVAMFGYPQPGDEIPVAVARMVAEPPATQPEAPRGKKTWDELSYAQQAGIACGEPEFWTFLGHQADTSGPANEKEAGAWVRWECRVQSRAELDTDEAAAERWRILHGQYRKWKADQVGQEQAEAQVAAYRR